MNTKNDDSFIIEGLGGQKSLRGSITINGAKNAALKAMTASLLFDAPVNLENIPNTEDIYTMRLILEKIGCKVTFDQNDIRKLLIDPTSVNSTKIDRKLAASMRSSVVLTGPLLARLGKVSFPSPGGCVIGARPIDRFLKGYEMMGAKIEECDGIYDISISRNSSNVEITFEKKTVGGTETLMMAAVLGEGIVTLKNCAQEPEIVNVAEWLNECGARISGTGTEVISIQGTGGKLLKPKVPYVAIPDRIEAGSYLILGALCAEELTIEKCRPDHLSALIDALKLSGVPISTTENSISISGNRRPNSSFNSFNVSTREYPGFATDFQPQIATYLSQVTGVSTITENIYEGRFKYVEDLRKLGATILEKNSHEIVITGPCEFHGLQSADNLKAHDIRAGFAIIMAALVSNGHFSIKNSYFIDRGYEQIEDRLRSLGANIKRVQSK